MAAGAGEFMKREAGNHRVINIANFFRHGVEIRQKKSYHNLVGAASAASVVGQGPGFRMVRFLLFYMLLEYDNISDQENNLMCSASNNYPKRRK